MAVASIRIISRRQPVWPELGQSDKDRAGTLCVTVINAGMI